MTMTWNNLLAIVFAVVGLFLLASAPAAEGSEVPAFTVVDDSTELIADAAIDFDQSEVMVPDRLSQSHGGANAIGADSANHLTTDQEEAVLPGGAAGLASAGIRGPTKI